MSGDFDDWSDLQDAWRARATPDAGNLDRLRTRVRREQARMRVEITVEAAIAVFCAAVFLWWATGATGGARMLFVALALVSVSSVFVTSALRQGVWRAQGDTVAAYRRLLRRRARRGLLFARMGYVGAPAGVVAGLVIAGATTTASAAAAPLLMDVLGLIACAALAASWVWCFGEARRHRRMIQVLDDQEA